jgi:hypothetical protein
MTIYHSIEVWIQALALLTEGISLAKVSEITRISKRGLQHLKRKALLREYDSNSDPRIRKEYVKDAKRTGRSKEISQDTEQFIIQSVTADRFGREKSTKMLAHEVDIFHSSAGRILRNHEYIIAKPS